MSQALVRSTFARFNGRGDRLVTPEILFSMYSNARAYQKYAQFIFPLKVTLSFADKPPTFHTFESTDENGNQSFYHCFIFHEALNELEIEEDFDYLPLQRLIEVRRRQEEQTKKAELQKRQMNAKKQAGQAKKGYNKEDDEMLMEEEMDGDFMETSSNMRHRDRAKRFNEQQELHDTDRQRARATHQRMPGRTDARAAAAEEARQNAILEKKKAIAARAQKGHIPTFPEQQLEEEMKYLENLRQTRYVHNNNKSTFTESGQFQFPGQRSPAEGSDRHGGAVTGSASSAAGRNATTRKKLSTRSARPIGAASQYTYADMVFGGEESAGTHRNQDEGIDAGLKHQNAAGEGLKQTAGAGQDDLGQIRGQDVSLSQLQAHDYNQPRQGGAKGPSRIPSTQGRRFGASQIAGHPNTQHQISYTNRVGNLATSFLGSSQHSKRSVSSHQHSVLDLDHRAGLQEMLSHTNQKRPPRNKYKGKTASHTRHGTRAPALTDRKETFALGQQGKEPQYLLTENCGDTSFNAVEARAGGANQRAEPSGFRQLTARERGNGTVDYNTIQSRNKLRLESARQSEMQMKFDSGQVGDDVRLRGQQANQESNTIPPTPDWSNAQAHHLRNRANESYDPMDGADEVAHAASFAEQDDANDDNKKQQYATGFNNPYPNLDCQQQNFRDGGGSFFSSQNGDPVATGANSMAEPHGDTVTEYIREYTAAQEQEDEAARIRYKKLTDSRLFAPVAFVIQSKCEFHDAFKIILQRMYESLQRPKKYSKSITATFEKGAKNNSQIPDIRKCMAFAEIVSHMAFLRTIPAPVFNSQVNLSFMDTLLCIKENAFHELPHKSIDAIKILVDCLDFSSILTCLKALLFDKTLIIFSMETSLLFNVVEGLKQLMFPFTVDFQQFLPANDVYKDANGMSLKGLFEEFEGMQPVIFALNTNYGGDEYENYKDWPDSVLLDIDASFVTLSGDMQGALPAFPKELEHLKILNRIKNKNFDNYDKVYPSEDVLQEIDPETLKVVQIREAVFRMLIPYLVPAFKAIKVQDPQKQARNLGDYFDATDFVGEIAENHSDEGVAVAALYADFGNRLLDSRAFVHFMDGYIEDQIMNFDLVNSILCFRRLLHKRYKLPLLSLRRFDLQLKSKFSHLTKPQLEELQQEYLASREDSNSFADESVHFSFHLPNLSQRMMLFEKIQYIMGKQHDQRRARVRSQANIRSSRRLKQQNKDRDSVASNKHLEELEEFSEMDFVFTQLISQIRAVYQGERAEQEQEARRRFLEHTLAETKQTDTQATPFNMPQLSMQAFRGDSLGGWQPNSPNKDRLAVGRAMGEGQPSVLSGGSIATGRFPGSHQNSDALLNAQSPAKLDGDEKKANKHRPSEQESKQAALMMDQNYCIEEGSSQLENSEVDGSSAKTPQATSPQVLKEAAGSAQINGNNVENGTNQYPKELSFKQVKPAEGSDAEELDSMSQQLFSGGQAAEDENWQDRLPTRERHTTVINFVPPDVDANADMRKESVSSVLTSTEFRRQTDDKRTLNSQHFDKFEQEQEKQTNPPVKNASAQGTNLQRDSYQLFDNEVPKQAQQVKKDLNMASKTTKATFGAVHFGNQHNAGRQDTAVTESMMSTPSAFPGCQEDLEESSEPEEPGDGGTKILYGKQGFLQFLENLYALFKEQDKLKINFYFTIRDLIIDYCEKMAAVHESASDQNDVDFQNFHHLQRDDKQGLGSTAFDFLPSRESALPNGSAAGAQPTDTAADEKDDQPSTSWTPGEDPSTLLQQLQGSNKTSKQCRDRSIIASMAPPSSRVTEMKSMMTKHAQDLANSRGGQKKEQTVWCNSYRPASDLKCLTKSGISQAQNGPSPANHSNQRRRNFTSNLGIKRMNDMSNGEGTAVDPRLQRLLAVVAAKKPQVQLAKSQMVIQGLAPTMQKNQSVNPEKSIRKLSQAPESPDHLDLVDKSGVECPDLTGPNENDPSEDLVFENENPIWFWIEKESENQTDRSTDDRYWESRGPITYQEVMVFIKMATTFEDKRYQSQMILWLLLHFPLTEKYICQFDKQITALLESNGNSDPAGADGTESSSDASERQLYDPTEKLEYLFPLSYLQLILDNLCQQQVIDLYLRVSDEPEDEDYGQELSQIDRACVWKIKKGCCQAFSSTSVPRYKEVVKLVIRAKFDEISNDIAQTSNMYDDMRRQLEEANASVNSELGKSELDVGKMMLVTKRPLENKRDKMRNNYFETIDERVLVECSVDRLVQEQEYEECLRILKARQQRDGIQRSDEEEQKHFQEQREPAGSSSLFQRMQTKVAAGFKGFGQNEMFDGLLSAPGAEGSMGHAGAGLRSSSAGACSRESDRAQGRSNLKVTRIDKRKKGKEDKSEKRKSPMLKSMKFWTRKKSGQNKQKEGKGSDRANSADREPTGRKTGGFSRNNKIGVAPRETEPYIEIDTIHTIPQQSDQVGCQTMPHAQAKSVQFNFQADEDDKKPLDRLELQAQALQQAGQEIVYTQTSSGQIHYELINENPHELPTAVNDSLHLPSAFSAKDQIRKSTGRHARNRSDLPDFGQLGSQLQIQERPSQRLGQFGGNRGQEFTLSGKAALTNLQMPNEQKNAEEGAGADFEVLRDQYGQQHARDANRIGAMREKLQLLSADSGLRRSRPGDREASFTFHCKSPTTTKKLVDPITVSVKLLSAVIEFWTRKEYDDKEGEIANEILLDKGAVFDGRHCSRLKAVRLKQLQRIYTVIKALELTDPVFQKPENEAERFLLKCHTDKEYSELAKQCFYLNICNAMVLFKLAEIAVMKPTKLFGLKNQSSWIALQHHTKVIVNGQPYSLFELKYDVIKNIAGRPASTFVVDKAHVHPLIDYAFFVPTAGSLKLASLCFTHVQHLQRDLGTQVKLKLMRKLQIRDDFGLIRLPSSLQECFPSNALKINHEDDFGRQKYQLKILEFIHLRVIQGVVGNAESAPSQHLNPLQRTQTLLPVERIIYRLKREIDGGAASTAKNAIEKPGFPSAYVIEWKGTSPSLKASKVTSGLRDAGRTLSEFLARERQRNRR